MQGTRTGGSIEEASHSSENPETENQEVYRRHGFKAQ